jgi:hypothetical protein
MEHPDEEVLTQFALDDPLALDAATLVHISDCDRCTHEIQEIQRVVDAALASGGRADLRTLAAPPASVWERVLVEVGGRAGGAAEHAAAEPARAVAVSDPADEMMPALAPTATRDDDPVWLFDQPGEFATAARRESDGLDRPTDRRTMWQVAVAAAVGLVLGAGVTWLVADKSSTAPTVSGNVKTSALAGIGGNTTSGQISLVERSGSAPAITINIDTLDRGAGFLEAWLLDADTGGMVALGVVDGTKGTFTVPPSLNLSRYSQIDISREPFDGDPAHSTVSLARGPVPTS